MTESNGPMTDLQIAKMLADLSEDFNIPITSLHTKMDKLIDLYSDPSLKSLIRNEFTRLARQAREVQNGLNKLVTWVMSGRMRR